MHPHPQYFCQPCPSQRLCASFVIKAHLQRATYKSLSQSYQVLKNCRTLISRLQSFLLLFFMYCFMASLCFQQSKITCNNVIKKKKISFKENFFYQTAVKDKTKHKKRGEDFLLLFGTEDIPHLHRNFSCDVTKDKLRTVESKH